MKAFLPIFLCLSFFLLTGFTSEQPSDERAAQNALPQSKDAMWTALGEARIVFDNKKEKYDATFPADVKSLVGTKVKISGFMLPLDAEDKFKHFLLSKRTPTCPFCPPGEPNEIVEVFSTEPTEWDDGLVTYEGEFKLIDNQDFGLFYQINQAKAVKAK